MPRLRRQEPQAAAAIDQGGLVPACVAAAPCADAARGEALGCGGRGPGASPHDGDTGSSVLERRPQWPGTRDIAPLLAVPAAIAFRQCHDWLQLQAWCHSLGLTALHALAQHHGLLPAAQDDGHAQIRPMPMPMPHRDAVALRARLFDDLRIQVP